MRVDISEEQRQFSNKAWTYVIKAVLASDLFSNIGYIYMFFKNYKFKLQGTPYFMVFYMSMCVAMAIIEIYLIYSAVLNKHRKEILLFLVVLQSVVFVADIIYIILYGGFWEDGYMYLSTEIIVAAIYAGRYAILRNEEEILVEVLKEVSSPDESADI